MIKNPELDLAWNFVEKTNRNIFLTGKAGTGKTTFLHKIKNQSYKRLIVVAPTGVAAINAKGVTIHSFFQMPFGPIIPETQDQNSAFQPNKRDSKSRYNRKFNKKKIDIVRSLDLLIIDEISMVRADLLDGIDQVLRRYKDKNKVFGGAQVLMIGDLQQLAPVVKNEEWDLLRNHYQSPFFFNSKAFQESQALGIELKHIYRQDNQEFINILNEIRNNKLSQISLNKLNERFDDKFSPTEDQGYITLTTHNRRADEMNETALNKIDRRKYYYFAETKDEFPEYLYPTEEELELKMGAQVMFIKNDSAPEKRYFNGKIGKVVHLDKYEVGVRCPGDTEDIIAEKEIWENVKYKINDETKEIEEKIVGTFSQIPLKLAWAITIHKSQGLTFENAIIDAAASFAHGQTYVALSRCKTLEGIVLKSPINQRGIIQDARVLSFTSKVEEHQPDKNNLIDSAKKYQLDLIGDLFNYKDLPYIINRCNKIVYQSGNSLKGNFIEPLKIMKIKGVQELIKIADNFHHQLVNMSTDISNLEQDEAIQDRIRKAISYFAKHTQEYLLKPFTELQFTTDNKAIKKDFNEQLQKISNHLKTKMYVFENLQQGFNTTKYLELRAKAVLEKPSNPPKERKSEEVALSKHPQLFKDLRHLRHIFAMDLEVDHYQIFTQQSLIEMCEELPVSLVQLKMINGMGKTRIKKYGNEIIDLIKSYCEAKEFQFKDDPIPKSKVSSTKGDSQKISLALFKEGKSISQIAQERGLVNSTIENHLSSFLLTGEIKLAEVMDIEKAKKAIQEIKRLTYEGLGDLRSQLSTEVSYNELRMLVNVLDAKIKI